MSNLDCVRNPFPLCDSIKRLFGENEDKLDDLQLQIYIISGVLGGVALILLISVITIAVKLSTLRSEAKAVTSKMKSSNFQSTPTPKTYEGSNGQRNSVQETQTSPPPNAYATPQNGNVETELAQLGFSAYTGHPVEQGPRAFSSTSPVVNSAGGVRVLPRNPPTNFRHNAGSYNDGYM